jgi:hypothetical protein
MTGERNLERSETILQSLSLDFFFSLHIDMLSSLNAGLYTHEKYIAYYIWRSMLENLRKNQ